MSILRRNVNTTIKKMFKQYFSFVLGISQGPEEKYLLVHCFQNGILGIYTKRDYGPDNGILLVWGIVIPKFGSMHLSPKDLTKKHGNPTPVIMYKNVDLG